MSAAIAVILVAWIVVLLMIAKSVVKVPIDSAYVVTTLGRSGRVLDSGLHIVVPLISSVIARMSLLEQVLDVPPTSCATSDGTPATVRGTVRYRVTNPLLAATEVSNFRTALTTLATAEWTRAVNTGTATGALEASRSSTEPIRTAAAAWGIEVLDASPLLMLADDAGGA